MIPNPSLDCSYVVLNFWPNLSLVVLTKLFLQKQACVCFANFIRFTLFYFCFIQPTTFAVVFTFPRVLKNSLGKLNDIKLSLFTRLVNKRFLLILIVKWNVDFLFVAIF